MGDSNDNENEQWSCCNDTQTLFLLFYLAYGALALLTWNMLVAKPLRLMAVFLHEISHAVACWVSGGEVLGIEVHENEGGVTRFIGGCRALIIPAGYVGCGIWAMVLVILAGGRMSATFAAGMFISALLVTLCHAPNRLLVWICLVYAAITMAFVLIEYTLYSPILQFVILFYGVFVGVYAIADIWDDVVLREVKGSDSHACHEQVWPCCAPRCVGLQWALMAVVFQLLGIWVAIVEMSDECEDMGWLECFNLSLDLGDFDLFEQNFDFDGWFQNHGGGGGGEGSSWWNFDNGP